MSPTPRCVLLWLAGLPVALLPSLAGAELWAVWIAFLVFAAGLCAFDALRALRPSELELATHGPGLAYVGAQDELQVWLSARRRVLIELLADLDPELEPQPALQVALAAGETAQVSIDLCPRRRGQLRVERLWMRWRGPLGLVACTRSRALELTLDVVHDIGSVRRAALKHFSSPQAFLGVKTERYVGDGSEFESLRQYVPGLDSRSIDWKASARHRRLVCRRFRAERNHQIVLAIDSGHLMAEPIGGTARLDRAVHSALLLSYVALRSGDRVGLCSFDSKLRHFVEPQGGVRAFPRIQRESAAIDYSNEETNFTLGILSLSARLKRRTLVVVFTEFVDTVTAELLIEGLDRLSRRHLVLFVAVRDPAMEELEQADPAALVTLNRAVVASDLRLERERVFRRLRKLGVHVLDALPEQISLELVDRYLEIQRRELV